MSVRRLVATFAVLVALAALGGCMASEAVEDVDPINVCVTDDDCVQGPDHCDPDLRSCEFVCDPVLKACVMTSDDLSERLVLSITDEFGVAVEQRFDVSSESAVELLDVAVPEPVQVSGLVMDLRDGGNEVLPSLITFTRQSQYSSSLDPDRITVESSPETTTDEAGNPYNFSLRLVPGTYDVQAEPTTEGGDPANRPYYPIRKECTVSQDSLTCRGIGEEEQLLNLFYDDETTRVVSSQVLGPGGEPINWVRVHALDATGRLSAVAETGCVEDHPEMGCGRFSIAVPVTTDSFSLQISGPVDPPSPEMALLPTLTTGPFFFTLDTTGDGRLELDDAEINALRFPEREAEVLFDPVVQGMGRDGVILPLSGVALRIRSAEGDDTWATGAFELMATTDALGTIVPASGQLRGPDGSGIWLVPGTYDIDIAPPPGGEYSTTTVEGLVVAEPVEGGEPMPTELSVGARARLSGVVTAPSGPVAGVRVEASSDDGRVFVTTTDELGAYAMFVDRVEYDVMFIPPEGSLLSRTRQVDTLVLEDSSLDVTVGWGVAINGAVTRGAASQPIESAVVESYVVRDSTDPDSGPQLLQIGLALTAADGSFVVIVPDGAGF